MSAHFYLRLRLFIFYDHCVFELVPHPDTEANGTSRCGKCDIFNLWAS